MSNTLTAHPIEQATHSLTHATRAANEALDSLLIRSAQCCPQTILQLANVVAPTKCPQCNHRDALTAELADAITHLDRAASHIHQATQTDNDRTY